MTNTFVKGGNVTAPNTDSVTYDYIIRIGSSARRLNQLVKLGKTQGLTVTGAYRYSPWTPSLEALNVTFTGPRDVVRSLESYLDDTSKC